MRNQEYMEFEIYDGEGVLLTKAQVPDKEFLYVWFWGDRVYFSDYHNSAMHEYRIVKK